MKQAIVIKHFTFCIVACLALMHAANCFAQTNRKLYENYRLNAPLPSNGSRDVEDFQIAPDGQRVVYLADNIFGSAELYSVSIKGGPILTLNQPLATGESVDEFVISDDGRWAIYKLKASDDTKQLWSIAIDGSGPALLETSFFDVNQFVISKTNFIVFVHSDSNNEEVLRGRQLRTSSTIGRIGPEYREIRFTFDGSTVVYLSDHDIQGKFELYARTIIPSMSGQTLSAVRKLNSPIDDAGDVNPNFIISRDGLRVIYSANRFGGAGDNLLYSADLTGASSTAQILTLTGAPQKLGRFQITPDSQKVIFEARLSLDANEEVYNYYSLPVAGGTRTQLTPWSAGDAIRDYSFDISSDSKYLVLANNNFGPDSHPDGGLYRIDIDVGVTSTLKLNDNALPGSGASYPSSASITRNGKTVIYRTSNSGQQSIYALPIDRFVANNGTLLHNNPFTASQIFAKSANSEQIIYAQKLLGGSALAPYTAIFVNDVKGGNSNLISTNPISTTIGSRGPIEISANGQFAVYLGQETSGVDELFAVRIREIDDELCVPVRASNGKIAVICL